MPSRRYAAATKAKRGSKGLPEFEQQLVLFSWVLRKLGAQRWEYLPLDALKQAENDPWTGAPSPYVGELKRNLLPTARGCVSSDELDRFDARIVSVTEQINARRTGEPIRWKYFQYLALLFTELYLERWFADRESLRAELNGAVLEFNEKRGTDLPPYEVDVETGSDELGRLAFWQATGSGKTLLLHAHFFQYRAACERHGRRPPDNVLIVVPSPGLARQHEREARASGIQAVVFEKARPRQLQQEVDIISITSFAEREGPETVSVGRFDGNNLVFVDEGHRGSSKDTSEWRRRRAALARTGFCFEYSATLKQAAREDTLRRDYARSIVIDYSYRKFHEDGYGKHFRVLNLKEDPGGALREYFTGALVTLFQQTQAFQRGRALVAKHLIAAPLCIFVGASVTGAKSGEKLKESSDEQTDIVTVLGQLAQFVHDRPETVAILQRLLDGKSSMLTDAGQNVFYPPEVFPELFAGGWTGERVYDEMLQLVFHANGSGLLHVHDLKEADGELALAVGDAPPFGVVNVGDVAGVRKLCEQPRFVRLIHVQEKAFKGSLFERIDDTESPVNVLIGSRKFSEGWSSWRVSLMGLLKIGRAQGTQIIQLFGRGVRLRGQGMSLKRGSPDKLAAPGSDESKLRVLETLNVFGVRADYMKAFEEELKNAGVEQETALLQEVLPVVRMDPLPRLRIVKTPDSGEFVKTDPFALAIEKLGLVVVDLYPRVQLRADAAELAVTIQRRPHRGPLSCLLFVDHTRLYADLVRLRRERRWFNLTLPRIVSGAERKIVPLTAHLLATTGWYEVYAPDALLDVGSLDRLPLWQQMASELVCRYAEKLVDHRLRKWEALNAKVIWLDELPEDEREKYFPQQYLVTMSEETPGLGAQVAGFVRALAKKVERREFNDEYPGLLVAREARHHLYNPLLHVPKQPALALRITTRPVALNEGEKRFVDDIESYLAAAPSVLAGCDVYLLRNEARRGTGLERFYPDFMLWIVQGTEQRLTFVDPKGLRNIMSPDDPKVTLWRTLGQIERAHPQLGVKLDSWLVSVTPERDAPAHLQPFELHHIVEQSTGTAYIETIVSATLKR